MIHSLLLRITCAVALLSTATMTAPPARAAAASLAQDAPPDKRPEIADLVAKLESLIVKKGAGDMDAIGVIDQMNQEFSKSGPKDRASIVKSLSKCFEQRRLEPGEEKTVNNKLNLAAAAALGQMGPESTKVLMGWIGHKDLKKDPAVQQRLIKSLGRTHDKDGIKTLVSKLEDKDALIVSAAAEAMGEFSAMDLAVRKSLFEPLLKSLMTAKGAKDQNANDLVARERYDAIAAPIVTSLGKLAKHDERDPEKWQVWWNKNRAADWDALK
jgi:HEAT repeat protein